MMSKVTLLATLLLTTTVLAQDMVHPDVRFDDSNDRFDLTAMIQATNRLFQQNALAADDEEDSRRYLNINDDDFDLLDDIGQVRRQGSSGLAARRADNDFAYHDKMDSNEGGTMSDFEENLKHFMSKANFLKRHPNRRMAEHVKRHGKRSKHRRSESPHNEQEVLMHYAVPIVMEIDGFMKVPLQ